MSEDYFKGTAYYYARFRPGYPEEFFKLLIKKFNLDKTGRLLDLGCGTGQLAIPLSKYFKNVIAMDINPEMLDEGKKLAQSSKVKNIKWVKSGSDDLNKLRSALGEFNLVTMGRSFHWMKAKPTLDSLYKMIIQGGGIVIVTDGTINTRLANRNEKWQKVVNKIIQKHLGKKRRAGRSYFSKPHESFEDVIQKSKFKNMEIHELDFERFWGIEGIIGYLYSTSYASKEVLGDKQEAFEKDLRDELLNVNQYGEYSEKVNLEAILFWKID